MGGSYYDMKGERPVIANSHSTDIASDQSGGGLNAGGSKDSAENIFTSRGIPTLYPQIEAKQTDKDFEDSGLRLITMMDWLSERNLRSMHASLVKGVKALERARQKKWQVCKAWWDFFDYQILYVLRDDKDSSIYGVVYEFIPKLSNNYSKEAPPYVIAFRGTMMKRKTCKQDILRDIDIIRNQLHGACRFVKALKDVKGMVSVKGSANICVAGHSLGASTAMLLAKTMAKEGIILKSYLFNPPFVAAPIGSIRSRKMKIGIYFVSSLITATLAITVQNKEERQLSKDTFTQLSSWVPNLFINPSDIICGEYAEYFKNQNKFGAIGRLAARSSLKGLLSKAVGMDSSEELHLIPSARITTSCSRHSHDLKQWFRDDLVSDSKVYHYER